MRCTELDFFLAEGALGLASPVLLYMLQVRSEAIPVKDMILVALELDHAVLCFEGRDAKGAFPVIRDTRAVLFILIITPSVWLHFLNLL